MCHCLSALGQAVPPARAIIRPSQRQEHCFCEDSEAVAHVAFQRRRPRENDPEVTGIGRHPAGASRNTVFDHLGGSTGGLTPRRSLRTGSRNLRVGFILVPSLCGGTRVFDALRRSGSYPQVRELANWTQSVPPRAFPRRARERGYQGENRTICDPA